MKQKGRCPICGENKYLDMHGKTTRAKSKEQHDKTLIGICNYCHINKVHGMSPKKFREVTGQPLSKYLNYRKKFWLEE